MNYNNVDINSNLPAILLNDKLKIFFSFSLFSLVFFILLNAQSFYPVKIINLYAYSLLLGTWFMVPFLYEYKKNKWLLLSIFIFSLLVSPKILVRPLSYDDWSYVGLGMGSLKIGMLLEPFNDHRVPLLKLILFFISKTFQTSALPYQTALVLSSLYLLSGINTLLIYFKADNRSYYFVMVLATISPCLYYSRVWFGGGFWLILSFAVFIHSIPTAFKIFVEGELKYRYIAKYLTYILILVGLSTQYRLFFLNYLTFIIYGLYKYRKSINYRLYLLIAFFTIFIMYINSGYIYEKISSHNELNSISYAAIQNSLWRWVLNITLSHTRLSLVSNPNHWDDPSYNLVLEDIPTYLLIFLMAISFMSTVLAAPSKFRLLRIFCFFNLFYFLAIVILARRPDAINTPYYQTFPYVMLLIGIAPQASTAIANLKQFSNKIYLSLLVLFLGICIARYHISYYDVALINKQAQFLDEMAVAICDATKENLPKPLRLSRNLRLDDCINCEEIFHAPKDYKPYLHPWISKATARNRCPDMDSSIIPSDSNDFSPLNKGAPSWVQFNNKYFLSH